MASAQQQVRTMPTEKIRDSPRQAKVYLAMSQLGLLLRSRKNMTGSLSRPSNGLYHSGVLQSIGPRQHACLPELAGFETRELKLRPLKGMFSTNRLPRGVRTEASEELSSGAPPQTVILSVLWSVVRPKSRRLVG
jgi:hypothetical protein